MKRFSSHIAAVIVAILVVVGLPWLPEIGFSSLGGVFSVFWLALATLALLAQMRRAELIGRKKRAPQVRESYRRQIGKMR